MVLRSIQLNVLFLILYVVLAGRRLGVIRFHHCIRLRYTKKSDRWLNTAFIIVNGALFNYENKYFLITPYCYHDYLLSSQHSNQVLNETAFDY